MTTGATARQPVEQPTSANTIVAAGGASALERELAALRRENRVLKIAVAELERVSERDTLTPLYNRRYFITALHHRLGRISRYGEQAAVIYVDVDQLKVINDRLGHAAGDFTLIEIAARLAANVRDSDVAARIGGDEFGLILDHSSEAGARAKLSALAGLVGSSPVVFDGHRIDVTASFGLAMLDATSTEESVLSMADADMYRWKAGAR